MGSVPFQHVRRHLCVRRRSSQGPGQMKTLLALLALCAAPLAARTTIAFDSDWRFFKGDPTGAAAADFNDSAWGAVRLPHDWSIEGPFDVQNPTGQGGGFLPAGSGWYRKRFTLGRENAGKRVFVEFDGVMANSEVWINGVLVGKRPYGYVSFAYDLTPHIKFGAPNVIAVRADNSQQPASRWYTGAGIYRHVRLIIADPVHLDNWGVFVTTPEVAADRATVQVEATVTNQRQTRSQISVSVQLLDARGRVLQTTETKP